MTRTAGGPPSRPLLPYALRRTAMHLALAEQLVRSVAEDRQRSAAVRSRAARLSRFTRLQRRADAAAARARSAREAVR